MSEALPQPHANPEKRPEPALFSLPTLYSEQPNGVRWSHAQRLRHETRYVKRLIRYCDLELKDREVGLWRAPEDFDVWKQTVEGLTDDDVRSLSAWAQDRLLTLTAHMGMATATRLRLFEMRREVNDLDPFHTG